MNSAVKPIFNESFAEKRGLWVPWTVHGTPLEKHKSHRNVLLKKKKKKNVDADADAMLFSNIQTNT